MRYKNNVLDKLVQLETAVNRVHIQVNRGGTQDSVNESIEILSPLLIPLTPCIVNDNSIGNNIDVPVPVSIL